MKLRLGSNFGKTAYLTTKYGNIEHLEIEDIVIKGTTKFKHLEFDIRRPAIHGNEIR